MKQTTAPQSVIARSEANLEERSDNIKHIKKQFFQHTHDLKNCILYVVYHDSPLSDLNYVWGQ